MFAPKPAETPTPSRIQIKSSEKSPLNIVFVIKAMSNPGGGAERVMADLTCGLAERGHKLTIITSDPVGSEPYYPISTAVERLCLGVGTVMGGSSLCDILRRMVAVRRRIVDLAPDVVVAFMHSSYIPVGLAMIGTGIPVIASEHIGPEHYRNVRLQQALNMLTPLLVEKITVVSEQIKVRFPYWLRRCMVVAPNPIAILSPPLQQRRPRRESFKKILLSVARLAPQKNQRCLISAFSLLAKDFPDWTLRIVGEGELREDLENQIIELGLVGRVELPGAISDVTSEYRNAALFVSPSNYESFGLATAEALLNGTPAVAFEDCPGTNILIENNVNGILVDGRAERVDALSEALRRLMAAPDQIQRLSRASIQHLQEAYGLPRVLDRWESLIQAVAETKAVSRARVEGSPVRQSKASSR